jgi:hypothetical protein
MHAYDEQSLAFRVALGGFQSFSDPILDRYSFSTRAKRAFSPVQRTGPTFSHHPLMQTKTSNIRVSSFLTLRAEIGAITLSKIISQPIVPNLSGAEKPKRVKSA